MTYVLLEQILRWAGFFTAMVVLVIILFGIWVGTKRPIIHEGKPAAKWIRSIYFYIFISILYFGLCYLLWIPFTLSLSPVAQGLALIVGSLLFFFGLGLILWGRLTLGNQYFVSNSMIAPLFIGHQLITTGPYAYVRHPMYLGILLTGIGGILLYRTWTMVFFTANFFGLIIRSKREEEALSKKFGNQWQAYCKNTPPFFPRFEK